MRIGIGAGVGFGRGGLGAGVAGQGYTARFGVGADNAANTGNFNTALYTGTTPANGTYGNFTVASGVISCNGAQTVGTYDVGGWPVQVISGYKAVANQTQFDALTPANSAGKTVLVREAANISVTTAWNSGGDFNYATILGDGADPRPTTIAGLADTSKDSRKHFKTWATFNTKKLIFDNLFFLTGSTAGAKVEALSISASGGGNFCSDIYVLRSYFSCSRPGPNTDYSGGPTTFPGSTGILFNGDVRRVSVRDNVVSGSEEEASIRMTSVVGWWECIGNWVDLHYYDGIRPPSIPGLLGGNLLSRPMARDTDTTNPHCDGLQFLSGQGVSEANAFVTADSRGAWQSHFAMDGSQSLTIRNIFVADNSAYQVSIEDPVGCQVANCTWVPKLGSGFPLSNPQGGIRYRGAATGTNDLLNSVFRASSSLIDASPAVTQTGNVDAQSWVSADWTTNFPNWQITDVPTLQNALQFHAAPSGGGAAAGKGANQNITSWGAERSSYVLNVTTPTVSNITLTATADGFTGTLRTDVGNNVVYYCVIPQAQGNPTYREIKEQRVTNGIGYGSVWCSRANAGTDLAISTNAASPSTAYKLCAVAENGWSKQSPVTTANFTTISAGITRIGVGAVASSNSTSSLVIDLPTALSNGDYQVAIIVHRHTNSEPTTPSGWTLIGDGIGWTSSSVAIAVYGRVRDGSEGSTLTINTAAAGRMIGFISAYRGVSGDGAEATVTIFDATSRATPSLTATANSAILHIWSHITTGGTTTMPNVGDAVASGYTPDGNWFLGAENLLSTSAGATATRTATSTISDNWNAVQVELLKA
jgi:hypothetical protein